MVHVASIDFYVPADPRCVEWVTKVMVCGAASHAAMVGDGGGGGGCGCDGVGLAAGHAVWVTVSARVGWLVVGSGCGGRVVEWLGGLWVVVWCVVVALRWSLVLSLVL